MILFFPMADFSRVAENQQKGLLAAFRVIRNERLQGANASIYFAM